MRTLAILCSDLHFSHVCPVARSAEPSWYDCMLEYIQQLKRLQQLEDAPIICAGDVFDRWNSPPELINFLIKHLPHMYAISGQHDQPNHNFDDINRSAYWTLVEAGVISNMTEPTMIGGTLIAYPFPWNVEITPVKDPDPLMIHLAVVHAYIWKDGFGYPGAPEEKRAKNYREKLKGYNAAVFGDNHKGFLIGQPGSLMVLNNGTFIRRKSDEREYEPQVGLLKQDGCIKIHKLDTTSDVWTEAYKAEDSKTEFDSLSFVESLKNLGGDSLDFRASLNTYLDSKNIRQEVRKYVLESLG